MSSLNRRALFAGTIGTAIAATVGKTEASPAAPIDGFALTQQLHFFSAEEFRTRRVPREMRVLMNDTTNQAITASIPGRESTPFQMDALHFSYGTMRIVPCPDIVDGVALIQFGDDPFIEIHG